MMAQKLRFSRGLKAKVPGAVTARVPAPTPLVEIFTGSAPIDWTQEATTVKVRIFFYLEGLSNVWLLFYQRFDAALLLWISLDSWLAVFHSRRCSYIRTDDPSTKTRRSLWVGTSRSSFTAILRAVWLFFFSPGAPVSSFLSQPIFTVIPVTLTFNKTKPALSSIAVVTKAIKRTDRTSLCCIWEHPQCCFPPFGQEPREA